MHLEHPQKIEEDNKKTEHEENKQKWTSESYISCFILRDSDWWEEGKHIETNKKNDNQISK